MPRVDTAGQSSGYPLPKVIPAADEFITISEGILLVDSPSALNPGE